MIRGLAAAVALTSVHALAGCATAPDIAGLEDRRHGTPAQWRALMDGDHAARAARAIGRMRRADLAPALAAAPASAAAEAAFAWGQLDAPESAPALLALAEHADHEVRRRAVEGLGKRGDDSVIGVLIERLKDPDPNVRGAAALALARVRGRRAKHDEPLDEAVAAKVLQTLRKLLDDPSGIVRWRAAYALSEIPLPGRMAALRLAAASDDAPSRMFALRGLARAAGEATDFLLALSDPDPHVAAASVEGLGKLGDAAAVPALSKAAARSAHPADHHVRTGALRALGQVGKPGDAAVIATVTAGLSDPSPRVRTAALLAVAKLDPGASAALVGPWSGRADPNDRIAAAWVASGQALIALGRSEDGGVAAAAMETLIEAKSEAAGDDEAARAVGREAVKRTDIAVRDTAVRLLAKRGAPEDLALIEQAFADSPGDANAEVRATAVRATAEHRKDAALPLLRRALSDPSPAVAAAAARAITELTGTPTASPPDSGRSSTALPWSGPNLRPKATLHTTKGDIVLELLGDEAPRHVRSFLSFAESGRFAGLRFHRVIAGFVAQGLDPRGDGWGTGGAFLRDEINPAPYLAGAVGMPNAGPDTGGCQVFITHIPTPHLDGRYTVFARVVRGMDAVHALDVGDVVRKVTVAR